MNFINDRELARRFKANTVPSKERFLYVFLFCLLGSIIFTSFGSNLLFPETPNKWDYTADVIQIIFSILGVVICYHANRKGDDKEFIERFICIGFPVIIQSILLSIPFAILLYSVGAIIAGIPEVEESNLYTVILVAAINIYYYLRLNSSLKIASGAK